MAQDQKAECRVSSVAGFTYFRYLKYQKDLATRLAASAVAKTILGIFLLRRTLGKRYRE